MKNKKFSQCNLILKAGDNPNTVDIDACRCIDPQTNMPFIISKFELDEDEIKRIVKTKEINICIMGNGWPPVLPTVLDPFKEHGFTTEVKGLPLMIKYRKEIEEMLKDLFYDKSWMNEDFWIQFLVYIVSKFNFMDLSLRLDIGIKNGHTLKEQLKEFERIALKIISKDHMAKFRENLN